ncbi:23675_t:CDS:1, partial [Racocetra persica]
EPESSDQYLLSDYDSNEEIDIFSSIEFDNSNEPNAELTLTIQPW